MLKIEKFALLFVNYRYLSTKMSTVLEFCTNGKPLLSCSCGYDSGNTAPAPLTQCCRSGSARIRAFWSDPDPIQLCGSGSDHEKS